MVKTHGRLRVLAPFVIVTIRWDSFELVIPAPQPPLIAQHAALPCAANARLSALLWPMTAVNVSGHLTYPLPYMHLRFLQALMAQNA